MDYASEARELVQKGDKLVNRKGLFKKPGYDEAAECYQKAGNLFKMAKDYAAAGDAYHKAAQACGAAKQPGSEAQCLQSALGCFTLADPERAGGVMEELIAVSTRAGRFTQAAKVVIQQAERFEEAQQREAARKAYERAYELLQSEANTDSEQRNCQLKIAEILAQHEREYLRASKVYEEVATKALKVKLLQFHCRGYFFLAFLCLLNLDDQVSLEDACERYMALDPNIDGSPEGDFMLEALDAYKARDGTKFAEVVAKLSARMNLRSNAVARVLLGAAQGLFRDDKDNDGPVGETEANADGGNAQERDAEDFL